MVNTHPHYLFVYGTLKKGNGNNTLLERHGSLYIGPAVTADKFLLNDGFPYVYDLRGHADKLRLEYEPFLGQVRGDLYRVTEQGREACDRLEGHPNHYCRTPIEVSKIMEHGDAARFTAGIYLAPLGWRRFAMNLQSPDKNGILEWGRNWPERGADFQRETGKRFREKL